METVIMGLVNGGEMWVTILIAQTAEAERMFSETAKTFGLAVAILITVILALVFILWLIIKAGVRWLKPLIENFFHSHLETMKQVQNGTSAASKSITELAAFSHETAESVKSLVASSKENLESQLETAKVLVDANMAQVKKLDETAKVLVDANLTQVTKLDEMRVATEKTNRILEQRLPRKRDDARPEPA